MPGFEFTPDPPDKPFEITAIQNERDFNTFARTVDFAYDLIKQRYEQLGNPREGRQPEPEEQPGLAGFPRWLDAINVYHVRKHTETVWQLGHDLLALIPENVMSSHEKFLTLEGMVLHDIIRPYEPRVIEPQPGVISVPHYMRSVRGGGSDEHESGTLAYWHMKGYGYSDQDARFVQNIILATIPTWNNALKTIEAKMPVAQMNLGQLVMSLVDITSCGLDSKAQVEAGDSVFLEEMRPESILSVLDASLHPSPDDRPPGDEFQGFLTSQWREFIPGREQLFRTRELPRLRELRAGDLEERFKTFGASVQATRAHLNDLSARDPAVDYAISRTTYLGHMKGVLESRLYHQTRPVVLAA